MTFKVQRGTFAKSTSGAPVSQEIDTGSGLEIKYIHFWTEKQVGSGFSSEDMGHAEGWSNVTNEVNVASSAEDNQNGPDSSRRMAATALAGIAPNGALDFEGTVTSFGSGIDAGKFTINWTTNDVNAVAIYYEAYCGDAILNVDIGTIVTPNSTGNEAITGIGFEPNFLQYCSIGKKEALPNTKDDAHTSIGQAVGSTKRNTESYYINNGGADTISTQVDLLLRTMEFGGMGGPAQVKEDIDFVSFDADGWTHNMVVADGDADIIGYLAVEFDPLIEVDIGAFNQPTTTGAVNTTTTNKNIQAVIFRSQNRTTTGSIINDGIVRITTGIGVLPAADEQVTGFDFDDSGSPSEAENMGATNKAIKFFEQLSTIQAEANLIDSTVDSDFRLDWTTVDATARSILYLAFSFETETKTLTHTTDSVLKKLDTEISHTTDSFLKAARQDTHSTDSVLVGEQTRTHTTDSFLANAIYLTHTTDSILLEVLFQQHTTDSLLKEIDVLLTHTTDSYLIDRDIEKDHTTDSYLIDRDILLTHTTDSVLGEREPGIAITHTTDSYLINRDILLTHTTDSVLGEREPGIAITHTTDSYLIDRDILLTHTTDSYLIDRDILLTHTTDSVLGEREPGIAITHTTDSILKQFDKLLTHSTDSVLGERLPGFSIVHTTDSVLRAALTLPHTTDSILKQLGIEVSHTTDSVCGEREPGIAITHTTDSVFKKLGIEVSHTTDSHIFKKFTLTHTTDSYFFHKIEIPHTTDSIARKKLTNSHTTDSILGERLPGFSEIHTTDSVLQLEDNQKCHMTDSLLRRTRWPQKEEIRVFLPNTDDLVANIQQEYPQFIT